MNKYLSSLLSFILLGASAWAGEQSIVSIRDFTTSELKYAGIDISQPIKVHILALGGGDEGGWGSKSNGMFAYGWIINAETKDLVWEMTWDNTSESSDDRKFDGTIELAPGKYEVYFTAFAFAEHSTFSHFLVNLDHRKSDLFGSVDQSKHDFFGWLKDLWSGDMQHDFFKRAPKWGIDLLVDQSVASTVNHFNPPLEPGNTVSHAIGLGDNQCIRIAFELRNETTLNIYAIGEQGRENDLPDGGWIVNLTDRKRVWDMDKDGLMSAGGASKNILCRSSVTLDRGQYLLYYITDNSHSMDDWNAPPPYDPLDYGITVSINDPAERADFRQIPYNDYDNVIVSIVRQSDDEHHTDAFVLKQDADLRVYAIGERSNARRSMADYGLIVNARSRAKVWTMDVERTEYAGGAPKNRYIDEIIHLPKGAYEVSYTTDDTHSFNDWNDDPPFDAWHYGITVMGVGSKWDPAIVGKYAESRDKSIIAQIVRPGDNEDRQLSFHLGKPTRIRVYAIGEGMGHEMFDYGWIENAKSGEHAWEMSYPMTFYAGGARKNRMVNTGLTLEPGDYVLRWKSDDSHSYNDWNSDPPDDQEYWGITIFRDEGEDFAPKAIVPPEPPDTPPIEHALPPPVPKPKVR